MPATFTIPLVTVIAGQTITASERNAEFENIDTNFVPAGMDDYSATDGEMQTSTDPYPGGATSRPTSLQGELERLRYVIAQLSGETYWYQDPDISIASFKTNFDAHTHDGTSNNGPQIQAGGLASNAVTTAKILDSNVTTAKIADSNVTTAKIADSNVTTAKIADANVTSAKLASSLSINTLDVTTLNTTSSLSFAGFNLLKIYQIVTASTSTQTSRTISTYANTNLTASITPKVNTSKILIFASGKLYSASGLGIATLGRNGTDLSSNPNNIGMTTVTGPDEIHISLMYYDSPSTTSSTTYGLMIRSNAGGAVKFPYDNGGASQSDAEMILIEIGA